MPQISRILDNIARHSWWNSQQMFFVSGLWGIGSLLALREDELNKVTESGSQIAEHMPYAEN